MCSDLSTLILTYSFNFMSLLHSVPIFSLLLRYFHITNMHRGGSDSHNFVLSPVQQPMPNHELVHLYTARSHRDAGRLNAAQHQKYQVLYRMLSV